MSPARRLAWLAAALLGGMAAARATEGPGDPDAGRRLAETWCAGCHAVAPGVRREASDAAPAFPSIAAMPSTTVMSLRVFLATPHAGMPDLHLSRQETDDVIAYLLGLRGR